MPESNSRGSGIDRRRVLQTLGGVSVAGLAGCQGGGQNSGNNSNDSGGRLGERVPPAIMEYWANLYGPAFEAQVPIVKKSIEKLGMDVEVKPTEFSSAIDHVYANKRNMNIPFWAYNATPSRLDPNELLHNLDIQNAGNSDDSNWAQYPSCKYSVNAALQGTAPSQKKRQEHVTTALATAADDAAIVPTCAFIKFGLGRADEINWKNIGDRGLSRGQVQTLATSTSDRDRITVDASSELPVRNPLQTSGLAPRVTWNNIVYSPLTEYDKDLNLRGQLATDWEIKNDGKKYTFELKDGTFHNGDPITADDVKFTYRHVFARTDLYPKAETMPLNNIKVVDEKTITFNFDKPYWPFLNVQSQRWGILPRGPWEDSGKADSPTSVPLSKTGFIGSGPWQVQNMETGSLLQLERFNNHPTYSPNYDLTYRVYSSEQSKIQAFKQNNVQMITELSADAFNRIQQEMGDSVVEGESGGWTGFYLFPQHSHAPFKFLELRRAVGAVLNRKQMNDSAFQGSSEPIFAGVPFAKGTPARPKEKEDRIKKYTNNPEGDVDAARQMLANDGWGWDYNDNLHYPPDANLSPRWPKGEQVNADEFKCLNEKHQLVLPDGTIFE